MTTVDKTAQQRADKACANRSPIGQFLHWTFQIWKTRNHPALKTLDAHLVRDIGLSEDDIAAKPHKLPSQTTHHPRG